MESKKINQLATELAPDLSDLTIIGDPTTGISKKITLSQMASLFTGTVEEYANFAAFPLVGVADTIYIALDTNIIYRWNTGTSAYVELSPNIVSSLVFNDANGFDGTINLVGSVATLTITTALTTGSVGFIGASGALLQDNSNFFWDDTNNRLGLGTNAPTTALDVFGSGIIGRINGTSTNNAFLGFASAGTNKWSIGNVQSDHRFRIYNEATTSELVSVLSTGEFGIGIANPTTKFHIDGAASALIANLDANVSVAKSISFRSDNSNRINLEVSGTESGSNAGADFFLRTYTDAGSLLNTPVTIKRSTGDVGIGMTPTKKFQVNTGTNAILSVQFDVTDRVELGAFSSASGYRDLSISGSTITFGTTTAGGSSVPTKMTILPSGNIGIGNTTALHKVQIGSNADQNTSIGKSILFLSGNAGNIGYVNEIGFGDVSATNPQSAIGNIITNATASSFGDLYFATRNVTTDTVPTEKMRITSSGYIGIGTINPLELLHLYKSTTVYQMIQTVSGGAGTVYRRSNSTTPDWTIGHGAASATENFEIYTSGTGSCIWTMNGSDRMRILPDGQVLLNTSSVLTAGFLCISVNSNNFNAIVLKDTGTTYGSGNYYQIFTNSSNTISGSISHNTITGVNFNTSSDYRLKEDFKDFNGLDILSNIKFYDFKWKNEDKRMHGVIAHELESLIPLAVSGVKDAIDEEGNIVAQGVDYSKIVPILGKAIQQLKAEIEELKSLINK